MSNFNELAKILAHEQAHGCEDSSIIGGMENFVGSWARRTRNRANATIIQEILDTIAGYGHANTNQRNAMIRDAVNIARQYEITNSHLDYSLFEEDEAAEANSELFHNKWRINTKIKRDRYPVIYKGGHKGINFYLRNFSRHNDLAGYLYISTDGVEFETSSTKSTRKYSFPWKDIRDAAFRNVGFIFQKKQLDISTREIIRMSFETENAEVIASVINRQLLLYKNEQERLSKIEKSNIEANRLDQVSPQMFEALIGKLFEAMGYSVLQVGQTGDEGIDLLCRDAEHHLTVVQCKRYKGKVGQPIVRDFYGALMHRNAKHGYLVTTGDFSAAAQSFATRKPITLVNGSLLRQMQSKYTK